ncbi:hypothetical protein GW915_00335 [bacterium]|nr:hypothetical protein [bacterium]
MSTITNEIKSRFQASFDSLKEKRPVWDSAEELFHGQLNDAVSSKTKSQVFDHRLSTLIIERAYRVMAQLPVGKVRGISKNDLGDAKLKNLILDKYIIPNANAQFDFLTKLRLVDMYSNIYGSFYSLVDWDVKPNGYIGPDIWLLNIRDVFPQVGAVSVEDSEFVIVRTWQPISYFENLKKQDGFKNISQIVEKLKKKAGSKEGRDSANKSKRGETQYPESPEVPGKGFYEVLTQFERDRWVDYCVDADIEFRDGKNPHDNGELPISCKYSMPLLDDVMGMGDMERGDSMQRVINAVWNLYLDGVKMSIFPPALINKDNIAAMSSIKWGAAEKWLVRGQIDDAVKTIQLSPQGISTFNNTQQTANASLLNLFGTSDTTVTQATDAGYGKTPQALQMQQARENTRDLADRFYMERYLASTMKKMVNLISKKQSSAITVRMFKEEIEEIARSYPEVADMYDEEKGKLSINKGGGSNLYDYEIVSGSTAAMDSKAQQENLSSLITLYIKSQTPNGNTLVADLDREGYTLKFGELFKKVVASSGIQDWDKILVEKTEEEKDQTILQNDAQVFQNVLAQMQQGQNMNATPPQPDMGGQMPQPNMGGMQ